MMLAWVLTLSLSALPETHLGPSQARTRPAPASIPRPAPPSRFPLRTRLKAQIGNGNPARLNLRMPLARPVCVVGADPLSAAWLRTHASALHTAGALCYLIAVEREREVAAIQAAATPVPVTAIPGHVFEQIGLLHYPALIQVDGTVQ